MPTLRLVASSSHESRSSVSPTLVELAPLFDDVSLFGSLTRSGVLALLRDLAFALSDLSSHTRERVVVPTGASSLADSGNPSKGAPWELGLERDGATALVTVFRQGARPRVVQADRIVALSTARQTLLAAIASFGDDPHYRGRRAESVRSIAVPAPEAGEALVDADGQRPSDRGLALAREQLLSFECDATADSLVPPSRSLDVVVASPARGRLGLSARIALRRPVQLRTQQDVARSDLHALLFTGEITATVGASARAVQGVHVFLVAESLLELCQEMLSLRSERQTMLRQLAVGRVHLGVQLEVGGLATLLFGLGPDDAARAWRLPPVPAAELARAAANFALSLATELTKADARHEQNLRLARLRERAELLRAALALDEARTSQLNGAPESYRAFAESDPHGATQAERAASVGKLRFSESWRAEVPGIDLRSIHLAGDRLFVGSQRELACIERTTGQLVWVRRAQRGVSIPTPAGIVRLSPEGRFALHDMIDGERLYELRLSPCSGARTAGAVVNAPGLPHLVLVGDGERHLSAIDVDSGEVRWRRAIPRTSALKLRRAGKLMIAATGDPDLLALDLLSGEVVWRHVGRGRFQNPVALDRDELFAVATTRAAAAASEPLVHGALVLSSLDPWSGAERWQAALPRASPIVGAPIAARETVLVVTSDRVGGTRRLGLVAFDRATGELRFDLPGGLAEGHAARILVDDLLIANSELGELVAIDARDGKTRFRHVFAGSSGALVGDRPRSLDPVLRSGALFVPQAEVYVVRPADGAIVGRAPSDLVPDAMHVDERCGVYVAEASGYVAAYHALPMLTLVEPR